MCLAEGLGDGVESDAVLAFFGEIETQLFIMLRF
jgi:hypothetical protein